jgi:hypothetical protein
MLKRIMLYNLMVMFLMADFASADWGDVNLFTIITGIVQEPPETRDDLVYQGSTGNESDTDVGYGWDSRRIMTFPCNQVPMKNSMSSSASGGRGKQRGSISLMM